ncbi:MAG: DEAD/DEAH box helicase family protein [bacterium]
MLPEEKARTYIDRMFEDAGWDVVSRNDYTTSTSAVAVAEGIMQEHKEADYLLFLDGKAIGILEAKAEHVPLEDKVKSQAEGYTTKLPKWCSSWFEQLPFVYISNGKTLLFRDMRASTPDYTTIPSIHTPKELSDIAGIKIYFSGLPKLKKRGLRDCQYEAIKNLETSFRNNHNRVLMVLATGAGKTYTACMVAYRLLAYTPTRRILFLVDRNNLGKQAEGEFGTFRLTENGEPFNTIYTTTRLKSAYIPNDSNLIITTIQRLFSVLTGKDYEESDNDELSDEEREADTNIVEIEKTLLPQDYFDAIIIDECHRSIYGNWKKVLDYFNSARLIGLTATPAPETIAFFNKNCVINYNLERSIADGINVDYRVYRIATQATEDGGIINENEETQEIKCISGASSIVKEEQARYFAASDLNRSVINLTQIRVVLESYRDAIYSDLYPDREPKLRYIPKTLIFAQNDAHATNIVKIAKTVFADQCDDFIQKITYSAGDSNKLVRSFRNDKTFRIAVTVTLVATGTDIKPLEVVMFMRNVNSESLYTQMKGRGVRTIGDEQLKSVTPNAQTKDLFYLIDAVGVTEHEKYIGTREQSEPATLSLKQLLEQISHSYLPDEHLRLLASRLSRINTKTKEKRQQEFEHISGISMRELAMNIFNTMENGELDAFVNVNEPNLKRKELVALLTNNAKAKNYLLELNAGFITVLMPGEDTLINKGFSIEEANDTTQAFENYLESHKNEIEALRIIYNNKGEAITYQMLKELEEKLLMADRHFKLPTLWSHYSLLKPQKVKILKDRTEREALTNLIQLVRFAYKSRTELKSLTSTAASRFELWCGQIHRDLNEKQKELMKIIAGYIATNGAYTRADIAEQDQPLLVQTITSFGSKDSVDEILISLSKFILAA